MSTSSPGDRYVCIWKDRPSPVALDFMNEDHANTAKDLDTMIEALEHETTGSEALKAACRAFLEHNREHFAREEEAMQNAGFPPYPVHKAEHARLLRQLEALVGAVEAGRINETVREAIREIPPAWHMQHVQTMDTVTANWVRSRHP